MRKSSIIPAILGLAMTVTLLFVVMNLPVTAQDTATPTPFIENWYLEEPVDWDLPYVRPGTSEGNAEWHIENATFESDYPNGFRFSIDVNSNQGEVVLASVIWSYTPHKLHRLEARNLASDDTSIQWRHDEEVPPWVSVNYYWSFTDSAGNRYRTNWITGNEYIDPTSEWTRAESADIIVFLQEGLPTETIDYTFDAMEAQRDTYLQAWGGSLSYKPRVILFSNTRDFQRWRFGIGGNSVIGQTSEEWGATVQVISDDDPFDLAYGTVLHEVGHLYQFEYALDGFEAGSWFTEGNATLFELHQQYDYEGRIRKIAQDGDLPVLLQGRGPFSVSDGPDRLGRYGYDLGYTFWKWIVVNYGLDAHRRIVEGLSVDTPRNVVLEQVLGISTIEMERQWALWLGADAPAPSLVPTWTLPPFPATVTPFQFPTSASQGTN